MKPKRLNLSQIWSLYLLLKPALSNRKTEEFLLDEVEAILDIVTNEVLIASLHVLYDNLDEKNLLGIQKVSLFLQGLKENEFFVFVDFIKDFSNGAS